MVNLRKPITKEEMDKIAVYFIFLYEPATEWRNFCGAATQMWEAQRQARKLVDDACKTEGWVYKWLKDSYHPIGYFHLSGDGGEEWKQLLSDHIFYQEEPLQADGDVLLPGWGFWDETGGCGGCGFQTIEATTEALKKYAETL